jgi:hypothetical protein
MDLKKIIKIWGRENFIAYYPIKSCAFDSEGVSQSTTIVEITMHFLAPMARFFSFVSAASSLAVEKAQRDSICVRTPRER